jgi:hypothetical protein
MGTRSAFLLVRWYNCLTLVTVKPEQEQVCSSFVGIKIAFAGLGPWVFASVYFMLVLADIYCNYVIVG